MMAAFSRIVILIGLVMSCGCQKSNSTIHHQADQDVTVSTDGNLIFYDQADKPIASINIALPSDLPPVGSSFRGTYVVTHIASDFPPATLNGRYNAYVHDDGVSIDLSDGMADNNITFNGQFKDNTLHDGTWRYSTFAGSKQLGKVKLVHNPGE